MENVISEIDTIARRVEKKKERVRQLEALIAEQEEIENVLKEFLTGEAFCEFKASLRSKS